MKKYVSPALFTVFLSIIILFFCIIIIPIGTADRGSFQPAIAHADLYSIEKQENQYFDYFSLKYGIMQYYNETKSGISSSVSFFTRIAVFFNQLILGKNSLFDIRFLGIIQGIFCITALYLLIHFIALEKQKTIAYLSGVAAVFLFADTGYTAFFNSFYARGFFYTGMLLIFSSIFLMWKKKEKFYLFYTIILLESSIIIFLNRQYSLFSIFFIFLFGELAYYFRKEKQKKLLLLIAIFIVFIGGLLSFFFQKDDSLHIDNYHALTRGVLLWKEDPQRQLEKFQIENQYSILQNTYSYERNPIVSLSNQQIQEEFLQPYTAWKGLLFYLSNPSQLKKIWNEGMREAYHTNFKDLGNYTKESGKQEGEQTTIFCFYNKIRNLLAPKTFGFFIIWILTVLLIQRKNKKKLILFALYFFQFFIMLLVSIVLTGDTNLSEALFIYCFIFDFINFLGIVWILEKISKKIHKRKKGMIN